MQHGEVYEKYDYTMFAKTHITIQNIDYLSTFEGKKSSKCILSLKENTK